eukprot:scaffold3886_cov399-Prasinococcus_capsulatus_cf.AAC.22
MAGMGTYDGGPKSRSSSSNAMYILVGIGLFALGYFVHGTVSPRLAKGSYGSSVDTEKLLASVKSDLVALYERTQCMPIIVRLAWHDAGTYSKWDNSGGPNGSIRFLPETAHPANNGLKWAIGELEPIKAKHPGITYADLYQYASVVAIEFAGGPKVPFRLGRKDATGPSQCTPNGRLPDAKQAGPHEGTGSPRTAACLVIVLNWAPRLPRV